MRRAFVNKIIPSSVVDGPGNRTAIFLQGCNLQCAYCHNPETQTLCNHCGACVHVCPAGALCRNEDGAVLWDESLCQTCDACIAVCQNYASPKVRLLSPEDVFSKLADSLPFIRGITVSGGECSLYPEFLSELFRMASTVGLTCLMDSNGMTDLSLYPALMELCDGVMLDIKAWDDTVHRHLTGEGNATVKHNLAFLAGARKLAEVRLVCVPAMVDAESVLAGVAQVLGPEQTATTPLKLISFRPFGVRGALSTLPQTPRSQMEALFRYAQTLGFLSVSIL